VSAKETEARPAIAFLALDDQALIAQCAVDLYRASGPGGQKRNKTSSAVRLRHQPTGLVGEAVEDRSQHVNRKRALRRLRRAIAFQVRGCIDPEAYAPSDLINRYRVGGDAIRISTRNDDYFTAVAEVLDVLEACGLRVSQAAALLDMSTAHLVKFLRNDEKLWARVNQLRAAAGHKTLR